MLVDPFLIWRAVRSNYKPPSRILRCRSVTRVTRFARAAQTTVSHKGLKGRKLASLAWTPHWSGGWCTAPPGMRPHLLPACLPIWACACGCTEAAAGQPSVCHAY